MEKRFNVLVHDPTGEILKYDVKRHIPEFCDVIANNVIEKIADKKIHEWMKKKKQLDELAEERIKIFNEWKQLSRIVEMNLEQAGASIFQNPYSIKKSMIDDWKSRVKIQHSHLNFLIKRLWKLSNNYLEKVKT